MDWLEQAWLAHAYISGAIVGLITFGVLRAARSRPERSAQCMALGVLFGLCALFEVWSLWPATLIHAEFLVGIALISFLIGFMLARRDQITFDAASRQFLRRQTLWASALRALFVGACIALLPLYMRTFGGKDPLFLIMMAWWAGASLSLWQRIEQAERA